MSLPATKNGPCAQEAETIVVGLFEDESPSGPAAEVDAACGGLITRRIAAKDFSGKPFETLLLYSPGGVTAESVLLLGLGPREAFDCGGAFRATSAAARALADRPRGTIAYYLGDDWTAWQREAAMAGSLVGCVGQDLYRSEKKRYPPEQILWGGNDSSARRGGEILGQAVNLTRELINRSPGEIYPEALAERAGQVAAEVGLECEIWDRPRLEQERCGAMLAVGRASRREPRLVILRYRRGPAERKPIALVGKGLTFDAGGLSLKTADGMQTMKCDMAGAATVLGAIQAIARLELPINIDVYLGLAENLPGGDAYKPGEVVTARNGKTIEVLNTDAEGRLVLADALCVAVDAGAERLLDVATLTGACVVALGGDVTGIMSNDHEWCEAVIAAADTCGEPAWELPMFSFYATQIRSEVADIKNVGEGRYGGAITAAKFLEEFVAERPWVHLDIAGPAYNDKPKAWLDAGATGAFVRTLVELVRSLGNPVE